MLKSGTTVDGGKTYALNVIPTIAEAGFDVRIPPNVLIKEIESVFDEWCKEEGLSWKYDSSMAVPNVSDHFLSSVPNNSSECHIHGMFIFDFLMIHFFDLFFACFLFDRKKRTRHQLQGIRQMV